ncbi:CHASE2 domain-containing protein [Vulcanococcus limneticus]|uniref:CHASE2 domain-containing protein n=1 Tax=Vulcanococcus limneticus TaxID=2170428 RepID=UPI00398BCA3A
MRRPPLWGLALVLPLLVSPWLGAADARLRVLFFQLRGPRSAGVADPVLLAVDADSLALDQLLSPEERRSSPLWPRMGAWPWSRQLQADLAAAVLEQGAERVVFNIVFPQPSRLGPGDDRAFERRLAPWRDRVVLAAAYGQTDQNGLNQAQLVKPIYAFPRLGLTALLQSPQGLTEAIPGQGWLAESLEGFPLPHPQPLAFAAAGRRAEPDPIGIDYPGPAGSLPQVPAWQVQQQPAGFWRGRTVLIGATAPELGDQLETPFGPQSGAQVQAAALATVLQGRGFQGLPLPLLAVVQLAWLALAIGCLRRSGTAGSSVGWAFGLAATALLVSGLAWGGAHRWLPVTALVAAPLLGGSTRAWGQWRRESRERAYLHQVLARRVSPALLRDILDDPGPLGTQLGGSRARCVLLFTDLVGFTPLSAELEPSALFTLLNRYFEAIATAVIEEQGLLDKFIGDALMAEFGVPRSRGDAQEALAAVRAALAMRDRLAQLNRELVAQGQPTLRQGIGLHVGEVIAGNLGSSQRLEFTVIGAAVNVASRLEGLTRRFPDHPILISGELLALLPPGVEVDPLGCHPLKGWPQPLEVFGLRGLGTATAAAADGAA